MEHNSSYKIISNSNTAPHSIYSKLALVVLEFKNFLQQLPLSLPPVRKYLVKTPRLIKAAFSSCIWHINKHDNSVYITFDDGPHPTITPWVLDELKKYNAKATFFCIGKNVELYPDLYARIINEGHAVGNHTQNHFNGWKVNNEDYLQNILEATKTIDSKLFRPPYGRITPSQIKALAASKPETKVVLWDVLSGDFDVNLSPEKCLKYVISGTVAGSIIVFHDSDKAFKRLEYALPRFLQHCKSKTWQMQEINY